MNLKNKETKNILILLVITLIILALPHIIRMINNNNQIPNEDSYYNLRLINSINDFKYYDFLEKRPVSFNFLYLIPFVFSELVAKIIMICLGLGSIFLVYLILRKQNIDQKNTYAITILLMVSPIFLYVFTTFNFYGFIIFLNLLALFFLIDERPALSAILFGVIPFIDFYGAFLSFLFLVIYLILNHKVLKNYAVFFSVLSFTLISSSIINFILGYFPHPIPTTEFQLTNIITDIGANIGFSFSMIILFVIGFVLLWEKGWKNLIIYFFMVLFLIFSFFSEVLRVYFNFILVIYAGFAFVYLTKRKWSINLIKKITLLLIVCSILFSTTSYLSRVINSQPIPEMVDGLLFLKTQSLEDEAVVSSISNGFLIEYFAEREAFMDLETIKYYSSKEDVFQSLLTSRSLEKTEILLNDNNIKYILIDALFKRELEEKDGFLFLIKNSNKFSLIYDDSQIEIWMYHGKGPEA